MMLPRLRELCVEHIRRCEIRGLKVAVVSARRTVDQQQHLFEKGRELRNGVWIKTGPTVTNALPGQSPHCPRVDAKGNVGCAAYDLAVVGSDEKPTWDSPAYREVLGPQGKEIGLVWGGDFHSIADLDHFELPEWRAMPLGHGVDSGKVCK